MILWWVHAILKSRFLWSSFSFRGSYLLYEYRLLVIQQFQWPLLLLFIRFSRSCSFVGRRAVGHGLPARLKCQRQYLFNRFFFCTHLPINGKENIKILLGGVIIRRRSSRGSWRPGIFISWEKKKKKFGMPVTIEGWTHLIYTDQRREEVIYDI